MSDYTPREIERWIASVDKLTSAMEALPEKLREENEKTYVRKDVLEPTLKTITDAITATNGAVKRHDDWLTWAQRLVLGAVGLAVLGLVLVSTGAVRP